ncbi:class I fructose-bisphosphate aldolase [Corynebacterium flavescens]|uniref:fructose-bisphosphate aldolase n=2 Tax=Corynebacterium flavescens TaxID=28028 RepID=A0AB73B3Q2_CORFL|nr:class I fructose-bisphosphate aldolase [Corynebacterium flavescens]
MTPISISARVGLMSTEQKLTPDPQQAERFSNDPGFVAALDQSGGSTPKALKAYGVEESAYSNHEEMFDLIHEARTRVITSPVFTKERILAAILFENTLDREIEGINTAEYLWKNKGIVPILKIDKGLLPTDNDVQLMKDIPGLAETLAKARAHGVFGTKERSVIHAANAAGIADVVKQQFEVAEEVIAAGLVPILEPEVSIEAPDKAQAEAILREELLKGLDALGDVQVSLKVTIPTEDNFYAELIAHPRVARVLALSGGYERDEAAQRLARNPGLIASFSRALLEGLSAGQSDEEFNATLNHSIEEIYKASVA